MFVVEDIQDKNSTRYRFTIPRHNMTGIVAGIGGDGIAQDIAQGLGENRFQLSFSLIVFSS